MLIYTLGFLIVALLAALLGFQAVATGASVIAAATFVLALAFGTATVLWQSPARRTTSPL